MLSVRTLRRRRHISSCSQGEELITFLEDTYIARLLARQTRGPCGPATNPAVPDLQAGLLLLGSAQEAYGLKQQPPPKTTMWENRHACDAWARATKHAHEAALLVPVVQTRSRPNPLHLFIWNFFDGLGYKILIRPFNFFVGPWLGIWILIIFSTGSPEAALSHRCSAPRSARGAACPRQTVRSRFRSRRLPVRRRRGDIGRGGRGGARVQYVRRLRGATCWSAIPGTASHSALGNNCEIPIPWATQS